MILSLNHIVSTSASTTRPPSEAEDPGLTLSGENFTDSIYEKPATLSADYSMPSDDGNVFSATVSSIIEISTDNVITTLNSNELIGKNFEQQDKRTSYCESLFQKYV